MTQESLPENVTEAYQMNTPLTERATLLEEHIVELSKQLGARLDVEYHLSEDDDTLYGISIDLLNNADEVIMPLMVTNTINEAIIKLETLQEILMTLRIKNAFNLKNNFTQINQKLSRHAEESNIFTAEMVSDFMMFLNMSVDYMASDRGVTVNGLIK